MAKRLALVGLLVAIAAVSAAFSPGKAAEFSWQLTPTGSTARLRGLSAVSDSVAWASGSLGTVLRTTNGGATWQSVGPPGTSALQFRDIEAFDADNAVILSIGNGTDSRVYVTSDGGATWTLVKANGLSGFRSVVAYAPVKGAKASATAGSRALIAVGPIGADYSLDDGHTWRALECAGFHTFSFASRTAVGWGAGEKGRVARLDAFPPR